MAITKIETEVRREIILEWQDSPSIRLTHVDAENDIQVEFVELESDGRIKCSGAFPTAYCDSTEALALSNWFSDIIKAREARVLAESKGGDSGTD